MSADEINGGRATDNEKRESQESEEKDLARRIHVLAVQSLPVSFRLDSIYLEALVEREVYVGSSRYLRDILPEVVLNKALVRGIDPRERTRHTWQGLHYASRSRCSPLFEDCPSTRVRYEQLFAMNIRLGFDPVHVRVPAPLTTDL
jgi:hypothetical protein